MIFSKKYCGNLLAGFALLAMIGGCKTPKTEEAEVLDRQSGSEAVSSIPSGSSYFPLPKGSQYLYVIPNLLRSNLTYLNDGQTRADISFNLRNCGDELGPISTKVVWEGANAKVYIYALGIQTAEGKNKRCTIQEVATTNIFVSRKKLTSKNVSFVMLQTQAMQGPMSGELTDYKDGIMKLPKTAVGLIPTIGEVTKVQYALPKCGPNAKCRPIAQIEMKYSIGCSSLVTPIFFSSKITDPRNDDPNIHFYIGSFEVLDTSIRACVVANNSLASLWVPTSDFMGNAKLTEDDIFINALRPVKPVIAEKDLIPTDIVVNSVSPKSTFDVEEVESRSSRMTCMAYWSGFRYNSSTKSCERAGASGCSNPFYPTIEECNKANNVTVNKPPRRVGCMAYWEGYNYNEELKSCEFRHGSGCSNPFEFRNLNDCLKKHADAGNTGRNDDISCMAYFEGYVPSKTGKKCVAAHASGCSNPFKYRTLKECRASFGSAN